MVDDVIACNYSIARAPARSSEKVIVSVDVNIARNTLPCWCVIMLAPVIRSVIPYQWFLSHCDPSHTNAPLTPTLFLLAASSLSLFEAWLVLFCVYQQTMSLGLTGAHWGSGDCFDYVVLRPGPGPASFNYWKSIVTRPSPRLPRYHANHDSPASVIRSQPSFLHRNLVRSNTGHQPLPTHTSL